MTRPDSGAAGQEPDMGTGRAAGLRESADPGNGAESSVEVSARGQSDERPRCAAEENFKAAFGHYPQRVELPEPTPDAAADRLVNNLLTGRDDYKPNLKMVGGPAMNSQTVNSGYVVEADLTGSRVFPEAYSVRLWGDWPGWSPDEIRLRCAEHYGVPVEQIAQPALMTKEEFDANSEVPLNVSRPHERQDENDSLYRYIRDTTESVRRGPWYLPPSFMLREQEADDEQR